MVTFSFAESNITKLSELEKNKNKLYTAKDNVLYYMDSGMLSYYECDYLESIDKLSKAEQLIDE